MASTIRHGCQPRVTRCRSAPAEQPLDLMLFRDVGWGTWKLLSTRENDLNQRLMKSLQSDFVSPARATGQSRSRLQGHDAVGEVGPPSGRSTDGQKGSRGRGPLPTRWDPLAISVGGLLGIVTVLTESQQQG